MRRTVEADIPLTGKLKVGAGQQSNDSQFMTTLARFSFTHVLVVVAAALALIGVVTPAQATVPSAGAAASPQFTSLTVRLKQTSSTIKRNGLYCANFRFNAVAYLNKPVTEVFATKTTTQGATVRVMTLRKFAGGRHFEGQVLGSSCADTPHGRVQSHLITFRAPGARPVDKTAVAYLR